MPRFCALAAHVGETNNKHGCGLTGSADKDSAPPPSNGSAQGRKYTIRRILVVDDEPQMRRVLRASLIARDYKVLEAASGEEALNTFSFEPCDCVLLDLNLPGLDGIDTCRAIRRTSRVPIIVVSIRDSEKDHVAAREAGADDYLTKPFGVDELVKHIEAVSRRQPDSAS